MNRNAADRIIVRSNERMQVVLDWFYENKEWLDREEFRAPMESGVIELQGEMLEFTFENKNGVVEITIYPTLKQNIPASIVFDYDPTQQRISNRRVAPGLPEAKRQLLNLVMLQDRTDQKEALKYHALMQFMTYYQEVVKVENQRVSPAPTPHKKGGKKHLRRKVLPLIRKSYIVEDFDKDALVKPEGIKRKYTKPEHEVNVRGYLRHYKKSGKTVWINPSVRYKGKETHSKAYEL